MRMFNRIFKQKRFQYNKDNLDHKFCIVPVDLKLPFDEILAHHPHWNVGVFPELKMRTYFMGNTYMLIIRDRKEDAQTLYDYYNEKDDERYYLILTEDNEDWYASKTLEVISTNDIADIIKVANHIENNFHSYLMERWM